MIYNAGGRESAIVTALLNKNRSVDWLLGCLRIWVCGLSLCWFRSRDLALPTLGTRGRCTDRLRYPRCPCSTQWDGCTWSHCMRGLVSFSSNRVAIGSSYWARWQWYSSLELKSKCWILLPLPVVEESEAVPAIVMISSVSLPAHKSVMLALEYYDVGVVAHGNGSELTWLLLWSRLLLHNSESS